jgi:uncharacterized protein (TIGR03083 family)
MSSHAVRLTSGLVDLADYIDAFEQSTRSLLAMLESVEADDWRRPTELPGWCVYDVVAHLAAIERELLGDPPPPPLSVYGPHVRDEFGRHMEDGVVARRGREPADVVHELRTALEARLPDMRTMDEGDPPPRNVADQRWSVRELLTNRAFDAWMHEQDIRRALSRPGNLDGPGAKVAREILVNALPILVARRARATPSQSIALVVTGPVSFTVTTTVAENGRAAAAIEAGQSAPAATASLRADWETVVRLIGGRVSPNDAVVEIDGDRALGRRLVDGLAITP